MDLNVIGTPLETCGLRPRTGFFRDGCCRTGPNDRGSHTVCAEVTEEFLRFSKECGNDLSTPMPEYEFEGLRAGDRWCVCAARWVEALEAGVAPPVFLTATHEGALRIVNLADLRAHALDAV